MPKKQHIRLDSPGAGTEIRRKHREMRDLVERMRRENHLAAYEGREPAYGREVIHKASVSVHYYARRVQKLDALPESNTHPLDSRGRPALAQLSERWNRQRELEEAELRARHTHEHAYTLLAIEVASGASEETILEAMASERVMREDWLNAWTLACSAATALGIAKRDTIRALQAAQLQPAATQGGESGE